MIVSASSLAKKARDLIVGANRACSNRGSWEDKCSHCKPKSIGRFYAKVQPIYNGSRLQEIAIVVEDLDIWLGIAEIVIT